MKKATFVQRKDTESKHYQVVVGLHNLKLKGMFSSGCHWRFKVGGERGALKNL